MQYRESWIQEILIENLLRRLCISGRPRGLAKTSQIYVPRLDDLGVTANDFPWAAGNG